MPNYTKVAREARIKVLDLIFKAQTSHVGSNLSAIDIMAVLFDKVDPEKDEVILSAGWKAAAWYYFLWKKGIITEDELNSFCMPNSRFIGLTEPIDNRWGLKFAGGSMGLGICAAVGFALSKKLKGEEGKVYVLLSDGECQIGTLLESAQIANHYQLGNLRVILDNNGYQAMGKTENILPVNKVIESMKHFFDVKYIYGHDYEALENIITYGKHSYPKLFDCRTIKGNGVSVFEGNNLYHYKNLSEEEYNLALKEQK